MNRRKDGTETKASKEKKEPKYHVDVAALNARERSPNILLRSRLCEGCSKEKSQKLSIATKAEDLMQNIAECCSHQPNYLRPGMPLKEAIFRVILSRGNRPTSLGELRQAISEAGIIPPYSTESSAKLLQRMADHSDFYGISRVSEEE